MAVNIDRSNVDQFYRYKMPRLLAKVRTQICYSLKDFCKYEFSAEEFITIHNRALCCRQHLQILV